MTDDRKEPPETEQDDTREPAAENPEQGGPDSLSTVRAKLSVDTPSRRAATVKRKWLLVSVGVFTGLAVISSFFSGPTFKPIQAAHKAKNFNLTPPSVLRQSFHAQTQASIRALRGHTHQQQAEIATILQQLKTDRQARSHNEQQLLAQLGKLTASVARLKAETEALRATRGPQPGLPGNTMPNTNALPQNPPGTGAPQYDQYAPPAVPGSRSSGVTGATPTARTKPLVLIPPGSRGKTASTVSFVRNPYAGYIPSGSFVPVVLLTGVEAGTASSAQANPEPVLLRIQNLAQLPGYARYDVKTCFATGSAYGSMSTERAYVRLASLSCIDKRHKLVLDAPLKGYVVDSDGMFGLRGKLVQREGALLGKALLAGFAQGLSNAFMMGEGTTTMMYGMGGMGAAQTLSGSQMVHEAGLSGASSAMQMLAKFYLDQAQSIFPVVVVRPGREATLVLSSGTSLHWHRYGPLYVRHIEPK